MELQLASKRFLNSLYTMLRVVRRTCYCIVGSLSSLRHIGYVNALKQLTHLVASRCIRPINLESHETVIILFNCIKVLSGHVRSIQKPVLSLSNTAKAAYKVEAIDPPVFHLHRWICENLIRIFNGRHIRFGTSRPITWSQLNIGMVTSALLVYSSDPIDLWMMTACQLDWKE